MTKFPGFLWFLKLVLGKRFIYKKAAALDFIHPTKHTGYLFVHNFRLF
jgi:hypothetical protein